mmetsp:Transcript_71341/g.204706  ORF Transcript_71341/g.204706 Transcript_71341/m.204706 type:complete len:247 (-) Transcript_71341:833-1573(-)
MQGPQQVHCIAGLLRPRLRRTRNGQGTLAGTNRFHVVSGNVAGASGLVEVAHRRLPDQAEARHQTQLALHLDTERRLAALAQLAGDVHAQRQAAEEVGLASRGVEGERLAGRDLGTASQVNADGLHRLAPTMLAGAWLRDAWRAAAVLRRQPAEVALLCAPHVGGRPTAESLLRAREGDAAVVRGEAHAEDDGHAAAEARLHRDGATGLSSRRLQRPICSPHAGTDCGLLTLHRDLQQPGCAGRGA